MPKVSHLPSTWERWSSPQEGLGAPALRTTTGKISRLELVVLDDSVGSDCAQPSDPWAQPRAWCMPGTRSPKRRDWESLSQAAWWGDTRACLPWRPVLGAMPYCFGQASSPRDGFSVLNPPLESSPCLSLACLGPLRAASLVRTAFLSSETHGSAFVGEAQDLQSSQPLCSHQPPL